MSVNEHPYKVSFAETESSPGIPERGWLDMDVRWLVTKDTRRRRPRRSSASPTSLRARSTTSTGIRTPRRSST